MNLCELIDYWPGDLPQMIFRDAPISSLERLSGLHGFSIVSLEIDLGLSQAISFDIAFAFETSKILDWRATADAVLDPVIREILREDHFLFPGIRAIWLNFDLSTSTLLEPILPWHYLVFHQLSFGREYEQACLRKLLPSTGIHATTNYWVTGLLDKLPEEAFLLGVSLPTKRNQGACRLVLYGWQDKSLVDYLQKIGWSGDFNVFEKLLTLLEGHPLGLLLDLDLELGRLSGKIGIEILEDPRQPTSQWIECLHLLYSLRLCTELMWESVSTWIREKDKHPLQDPIRPSAHVSWINHLKITIEAPDQVSAKIYFGVRPQDSPSGEWDALQNTYP